MLSKRFFRYALIAAFVLTAQSSVSFAKDYTIDSVVLEVGLYPDGSAVVKESRTMTYQGRFSYNFQVFKTHGLEKFIFLTLGEEHRLYQRANSRKPGTYTVSIKKRKKEVRVRWYHDTEDETRTFLLSYKLVGVVKSFEDVAQFYHNLIGSGWKKPTGSVRILIKYMGENQPSPEDIRAWLHGVPEFESRIHSDGRIELTADSLAAKTALQARILLPSALFPGVSKKNEVAGQRLIAEAGARVEEDRLADIRRAERTQMRRKFAPRILPVLQAAVGLFAIILLLNMFRNHTRVRDHSSGEIYPGLPGPEVPAAGANYVFYHGSINGNSLTATLIELAAQGFITFESRVAPDQNSWGKKERRKVYLTLTDDTPAEQPHTRTAAALLAFLHNLGIGTRFPLDELKKKKNEFKKFMPTWTETIRAELGFPFLEPESKKRAAHFAFYGGVLSVVCFAAIYFVGPQALLPAIIALVLAVASLGLLRVTPEARKLRSRLKRIRKYVRSAKKRSHFAIDSSEIDRYLAILVAIDGSKSTVKTFLEKSKGAVDRGDALRWFVAEGGLQHIDMVDVVAGSIASTAVVLGTSSGVAVAGTAGASGGGGGGAG